MPGRAICRFDRRLVSLLIVRDAVIFGKRRFGEFQKSLGLARNILTTRLRKLVSHGVLERVPASDESAYREYVPAERGRALYIVLTALRQWGGSLIQAWNAQHDVG